MVDENKKPEIADESSDEPEPALASRVHTFSPEASTEFSFETAVRSRLAQDNASLGLSAHWSVPWSDLMMVMFVLFAVLFAMQLTERDINEMFTEAGPASNTDV